MKSYYLAGGGDPSKFDHYWQQGLKDGQDAIRAIDEGTFHSAGGGGSYLISARKRLGKS